MRYFISGLVLATATLAIAGSATAATVVYEGKCQQLCDLPQVNGTVTSVSYFFQYYGYQTFALRGLESEGAPVYRASGTFNVSGARQVGYSFLVTGQDTGGGATFYYDYPISQSLTGNLSYYEGSDTFEIGATTMPVLTYVSGRGVDLDMQLGGRPFDSNYRIAIEYTPAIPEPSTWAMMLVGFGAIGFAMRRRSTKVSYA